MDPSGPDEDASATFFNHAVELAPIDNRPAKVRRLSMEEDYLYEQVMTFAQPPSPPAYHVATHGTYQGPSRKGREAILGGEGTGAEDEDVLPRYYCDVHMENVFQMKMEIEDAVKRAEYRNWRTMFVVLHGTALHIYGSKDKGWSWSKSRMHGPDVKPDNPPWLRKGSLERSYSLQHADVGIAADYHKYVASDPYITVGDEPASWTAMLVVDFLVHTGMPSIYLEQPANAKPQTALCHPDKGRDRPVPHLVRGARDICQVARVPLCRHRRGGPYRRAGLPKGPEHPPDPAATVAPRAVLRAGHQQRRQLPAADRVAGLDAGVSHRLGHARRPASGRRDVARRAPGD